MEDHAAILSMMTEVVGQQQGFEVVGAVLDAAAALRLCSSREIDVAVIDLTLPGGSGLELVAEISRVAPRVRVLIFSGNLSASVLRELLGRGVLGVVEKAAPLGMFVNALHAVAQGQAFFGAVAGELIKSLVVTGTPREPAKNADEFSEREKQVLIHLAQGMSSKEIAVQLGLSLHTIVNTRSMLMKKTGLHRAAQLSLYAAKIGLISGDLHSRGTRS